MTSKRENNDINLYQSVKYKNKIYFIDGLFNGGNNGSLYRYISKKDEEVAVKYYNILSEYFYENKIYENIYNTVENMFVDSYFDYNKKISLWK